MKTEALISQLLDQQERLVGEIERQRKRIHNLECLVILAQGGKPRSDNAVLVEQFIEASDTLGAFQKPTFETAD